MRLIIVILVNSLKRQNANLDRHPLYGAQSFPSTLFVENTAALLADGCTLLDFLPLETFSPLPVRKAAQLKSE